VAGLPPWPACSGASLLRRHEVTTPGRPAAPARVEPDRDLL